LEAVALERRGGKIGQGSSAMKNCSAWERGKGIFAVQKMGGDLHEKTSEAFPRKQVPFFRERGTTGG